MLTCLPGWWNNEMKPDRVSCCCFECKQFSHFHHGPRYEYWHLKSTGTLNFAIKPQGISCCILSLRLSFSAIDNTRQFHGFSAALDLKKMWGGQFVEDIVSAWLWMNILDVTTPASLHSQWRPLLPVAPRLPEAQGFPHICAHYFGDKDKNKTHICAHICEEIVFLCRQEDKDNKKNIDKNKHLCALLCKEVKSSYKDTRLCAILAQKTKTNTVTMTERNMSKLLCIHRNFFLGRCWSSSQNHACETK